MKYTKEELTKWLRAELADLIQDITTVRKDHPNDLFYQGAETKCAIDIKVEKILSKLSAPALYEACNTFSVALALWQKDPSKAPITLVTIFNETIGKVLAKADGVK